jgi:hypothetical protein
MAPTSTKFIDKIICEGLLIIALGATIIKDIESNSLLEWWTRIRWQGVFKVSRIEVWWTTLYFEPILGKVFFDYSLGGYSHRERWARTRRYFLVKHCAEVLLPSGASFMVIETQIFSVKIWLRHKILELCYRNTTRMPWPVMKVRPRDPSCVAWYTHMDALCWYISVSTTRRKS